MLICSYLKLLLILLYCRASKLSPSPTRLSSQNSSLIQPMNGEFFLAFFVLQIPDVVSTAKLCIFDFNNKGSASNKIDSCFLDAYLASLL